MKGEYGFMVPLNSVLLWKKLDKLPDRYGSLCVYDRDANEKHMLNLLLAVPGSDPGNNHFEYIKFWDGSKIIDRRDIHISTAKFISLPHSIPAVNYAFLSLKETWDGYFKSGPSEVNPAQKG